MEEWKSIEEFNGFYEVSNLGRFRSVDRVVIQKRGFRLNYKGRILIPSPSGVGYLRLNGRLNNANKSISCHRLVAKYFIENPLNKPCVNHKNGDTKDNRVDNLEWCTYSENILHSYHFLNRKRTGLKGEKGSNSILKDRDILLIRELHGQGVSIVKIAKKFNMSESAIAHVCKRRAWNHL